MYNALLFLYRLKKDHDYEAIPLPKGFVERFHLASDNSQALSDKLDRYLGEARDVVGASRILHFKDRDIFLDQDEKSPPHSQRENLSASFQQRYTMASDAIRKRVDTALAMNDYQVAYRILKL